MIDLPQHFSAMVRDAVASKRTLRIRGGSSKDFYGLPWPDAGQESAGVLDTRTLTGVVDYEPTELVVTLRAGTPLAQLESLLAQNGQMLAFEPPHFGATATVGGMVAAGLSGPRRATAGAVRDFVLGAKIIDGRGEVLSFGGRVMKNVAGYDVSRAMAGSLGTLGLLLEVSLKTQPLPVAEATLRFELPGARAIEEMNRWGGKPLPVSASAWTEGGELTLRLSGARAAVDAACAKLGGERFDAAVAQAWWSALREQSHEFFARAAQYGTSLWRLSVPSATPPAALRAAIAGEELIEWGGALRWFASATDPARIREIALKAGGHATLFHATDEKRRAVGVFQPLTPVLAEIHHKLKLAFDPHGVFNRGRLYADF